MAVPVDCTAAMAKKNGINPAVLLLGFGWTYNLSKGKRAKLQADINACKDCKDMLLGQLAGLPFKLRSAATHSCTQDVRPKSGCDYLENYNAGGDQLTIQKYGLDCDPNAGNGSKERASQRQAQAIAQAQEQSNLYIGLGIFLVMVIVAALFVYFRNQKQTSK